MHRSRRDGQAQTGCTGPDGMHRPRRDAQAQTGGTGPDEGDRPRRGQAPSLHLVNVETGLAPVFYLPPVFLPCPTLARSAPLFYLPALSRPAPRLLPCPTLAAHADQCPARKVSRLLAAGVDALRIACAATVITSRAAVVSVIEVIRPTGATRRSFLGGASKYIAFTMRP